MPERATYAADGACRRCASGVNSLPVAMATETFRRRRRDLAYFILVPLALADCLHVLSVVLFALSYIALLPCLSY